MFACASIVVSLQLLCAGPVGMAVRVEAGPSVYKGQEVDDVLCDASMHKEAKGLLFLEKTRFHRVGSMHVSPLHNPFVGGLISKGYVIALPGIARMLLLRNRYYAHVLEEVGPPGLVGTREDCRIGREGSKPG